MECQPHDEDLVTSILEQHTNTVGKNRHPVLHVSESDIIKMMILSRQFNVRGEIYKSSLITYSQLLVVRVPKLHMNFQ
jgi:hypothetical protein